MRELPSITSRRNPIVAQFRRAHDGGDPGRLVVEGVRLLEEAARARATLEIVLASPRVADSERGAPLLRELRERGVDVRSATEEVVDAATTTRHAAGVAALARRPEVALDALFPAGEPAFVVVAAGIADPGNLGTLVRTADAAGATGFATTPESASPWNDKAVRATAGSVFRIPVAAGVRFSALAEKAKAAGARIAASVAAAGEDYAEADLRPPIVLVLGSEGFGLPDEIRRAADVLVRVPLRDGVESLNVSAAGAVLCFAVARRRRDA
ncbi:MAG TPA: RNA methyltransferase [Planctomycetota bacterium]|nr:RNA methyltransferase [Planctomycetota bacterium]